MENYRWKANRLATFRLAIAVFYCTLLSAPPSWAQQKPSAIKADERIIFFTSDAHMNEEANEWVVPIHGWISEPEEDDLLRNATLKQIRESLWPVVGAMEQRTLRDRLFPFLVDNERGKRVAVRVGEQTRVMPESDAAGHFEGTIELPASESTQAAARTPTITCLAVLDENDDRQFIGTIRLIPPTGWSVVSDIDDTVKISNVLDKKELLRNTLLRSFKPVEGMAELYARWAKHGAVFHYVSSCPYQLYEPLTAMLADHGFPDASLGLKRFRLKDSSIFDIFADPLAAKPPIIETLLQRYPHRKFVLVGDSGEKDPEVYGQIARQYPRQVIAVYIRDVTGEKPDTERYTRAFDGVPRDRWQVFTDPSMLPTPRAN